MHKEYDPVTSDTSFVLLEKVLKIGSWTAKNVTEESAALREAEIRLTELVRRVPATDLATEKTRVAGMIYANVLGPSTKRYVMGKQETAGKHEQPKPDIRNDFDKMRKAVDELKNLEERTRPTKMDVSAAVEV